MAGLATVALLLAGRAAPARAQFVGGITATLNASPSNVAAGQVVTFSYSASAPAVAPPFATIDSVEVDYGDGQSDFGNTGFGGTASGVLTHVYFSPGTYSATLTATADNGATGNAFATVFVSGGGGGGGAVSVSVNASPSLASVGQPVAFTYSATPSFGIGFPQIRSMLINYGDGAPLPLNPPSGTVTHTYFSPGSYSILVTATDSTGASGQASAFVVVGGGGPTPPPPSATITAGGPYSGTVGQPITMTGNVFNGAYPLPQYRFSWNFGNGASGNGQTVSQIYNNPGTYPVLLTVVSPNGGSLTASTSATVGQGISISAGTSQTGTVGSSLSFGATVRNAVNPSVSWSFGDGTSGSGLFTTHTYNSPGVYNVRATATDSSTGQQASDTVVVTIGSGLSVDAGGPYRGVTGQPITLDSTVSGASRPRYSWDFGNGRSSSAANPAVTYSSGGTYTIRLTVTDTATNQTASDTATAIIEASGPVVTYQAGWNLVAGPSGTLFSQAGGPLYTFQAGDTAYEVLDPSAGVQAGLGYWAYFGSLTTVTMAGSGTTSATVNVPAGQYVMVGNPSATTSVTIRGADTALSWDPQANDWKTVTTLAPGAGAWVLIAAGGAVTLSP